MFFFQLDRKKILILIGVLVVPFLAINFKNNPGDLPEVVKPFSLSVSLMDNLYAKFSHGVRGTTALYLDLIQIKTQNRELLKENAELRAQLGAMTELSLENQRLNRLLEFKQKSKMNLLAAKVIGRDLLADHNTITINRGTEDGVKKGQAAITVGGAVGYIVRAEALSSYALLLTDRYAIIDAIVQRSRVRGIVEGRAKDTCNLKYLRRDDDVQKGDLIVTSGLDNIFPKGFPIGSVTSAEKSRYGMTQDIVLKPAVNPFNLEEVFIVIDAHHEDLSPPTAETQDPLAVAPTAQQPPPSKAEAP